MGKSTNILNSFDVNIVIFVNDELPPFHEQLDQFKNCLI